MSATALPRPAAVAVDTPSAWDAVTRLGSASLCAVPALLTLYLSFNSGGFFAGATGFAVAVLAGTVALRMAFVKDAFGGFSRLLLIAIAALAVYSLWSLISANWSHSSGRALLQFNLANLYLFALILFGSWARTRRRVRWTLVLTWLAMFAVCVAALATRLRPDLLPLPQNGENRLWFPMTYTDAVGLFALCAIVLAAHLSSSTREPPALRVLAAATTPVFAVTLLLTYSRAALLLVPVALIAYLVLAQPRGLLSAVAAAAPPSAFVLLETYHANLISNGVTSVAAVQQGRTLTSTLVLACGAAAGIRGCFLKVDTLYARIKPSSWRRWNARIALACCCGTATLAGLWAFDGQLADQWKTFTNQNTGFVTHDSRDRVSRLNVSLAEREPDWNVALKAFNQNPLHGSGAGTFASAWYRLRPNEEVSLQAHSVYLQTMGELGLVGLAALLVTLAIVVGAGFLRARGEASRSLWVVIGLVGVVWAIHAATDWDWEMPAVTLPVFVFGACALARQRGSARINPRIELPLRVGVCLLACGVAITGARAAVSDAQAGHGVRAFNRGDCRTAAADARASISAMPSLPEPYEILGYCAMRTGVPRAAVASMSTAVNRDPANWRYYYGLAVAEGSARRDPRPAIRQAELLNPQETLLRTAATNFRGQNPTRWQEAANLSPTLVWMQQ